MLSDAGICFGCVRAFCNAQGPPSLKYPAEHELRVGGHGGLWANGFFYKAVMSDGTWPGGPRVRDVPALSADSLGPLTSVPAGTRKSRLDCFVFCASFTTLVYIPHGLVQLLQVASCGLGPAPYIPGQVLRGRAPACGSGLAGPFVLFVFCGGTNLPFGSSGHRSFRILVRCTRTPLVALGTRPSHCQLSFLICCRREVRWVHAATRGA